MKNVKEDMILIKILITNITTCNIKEQNDLESVRDDERCGRSKEVNTPQLIGQRVRVTMLRF